ncbi:myc box-dependent-interacting protein 1 isoform X2 [Anopheles maculipalpis]|uniref:myc box-dependent-interacting protein 1 isoform X2 n=1 Tax=Anopheles maculipalpis TaxID=1496333 RepID=UPI0021596C89|nr:myc box-dependent-interacting protein 1 isoform X2 [Anopheles maculipalpis]
MAENKGMLLAKSVQKHAGRAKEKLLQNLGKVDRTADEIFDEHLTNFNRQHTCATRLQKEFSNYIRCVRAVQNASKSLMDAITEVYESQWTGSEVLYGQTKTIDTQYQQFSYKLADQVLKQLDTYALQFPEMKKKIDKRGRKLVDYDSQRHSFQSLQANAAKRKDDLKVTRGREQLEEAKSTYEVLNSELHDELPALYDSRILFLVTNLQTLFACEQQFHSETSKVYAELEAIVDKLATESQRGSYTLKKINANSNPSSPQQSPVKANLSIVNNVTNGSANANGHTSAQSVLPSPRTPSPHQQTRQQPDDQPEDDEPSYQNTEVVKAAAAAVKPPTTNGTASGTTKPEPEMNGNASVTSTPKENGEPPAVSAAVMATDESTTPATGTNGTLHSHPPSPTNQLPGRQTQPSIANGISNDAPATNSISSNARGAQANGMSDPPKPPTSHATAAPTTDVTAAADAVATTADPANADVPTPTTTGAAVSQTSATTTADLPPGVLYRVKATYKYVREDVDELSFEVGDVINVVEYEDPEDQEEGWLMGTKEGTNEKGMFPANFTRPL